jgi:hypothetical protein
VDCGRFVKKLERPGRFTPPTELRYKDVVATALTRSHLQDDVAGPSAYAQGYYTMLHNALRHWLANDFPFRQPYHSNAEIPG